jgi:hypothetical protein
MTIVWEQHDRRLGFASQVLLTIVVSGLVSMGNHRHAAPSPSDRQADAVHQLNGIRSALTALEGRQRKAMLATATLHRDLSALTAENGIIERLIAHVQAIRQDNFTLSEGLRAVQAVSPALGVVAGTASSAEGRPAETLDRWHPGRTAQLTVVTPPTPPVRAQSAPQNGRLSDGATAMPANARRMGGG